MALMSRADSVTDLSSTLPGTGARKVNESGWRPRAIPNHSISAPNTSSTSPTNRLVDTERNADKIAGIAEESESTSSNPRNGEHHSEWNADVEPMRRLPGGCSVSRRVPPRHYPSAW